MQRISAALLVLLLANPAGLFGQEPPAKPCAGCLTRLTLTDAQLRDVLRTAAAVPPARQAGSQNRGWIRRHPALVGAMVGAGIGAVSSIPRWTELYCATGGDEDCFFHGSVGVLFGTGAGAGIGALIGLLLPPGK